MTANMFEPPSAPPDRNKSQFTPTPLSYSVHHQQPKMSPAVVNLPAREEAFCIRWKGFHGNILEGIKNEAEFVDVTLACDNGFTVEAHKLILASSSPYFRKLLIENPCQHPVIILNEVLPEVLQALMTYMYQGEVFMPEDRLGMFFKTASSLEIKGISDTSQTSNDTMQHYHHQNQQQQQQPHPVGDLSLLAAAATSSLKTHSSWDTCTISKRRKTVPRRLDIVSGATCNVATSESKQQPLSNNGLAINLSMKTKDDRIKSPLVAKAGLLTIPNPIFTTNFLQQHQDQRSSSSHYKSSSHAENEKQLPSSPVALDMSMSESCMKSSSSELSPPIKIEFSPSPTSDMNDQGQAPTLTSSGSSVGSDEKLSPDFPPPPVSSSTTPEQMAALLGPSWKSRQPRLCQYCQRMFSNKFNLKQHILNMHTVGRELHCEICQKKVKNKWYLRRHHVTHHGAPLKK